GDGDGYGHVHGGVAEGFKEREFEYGVVTFSCVWKAVIISLPWRGRKQNLRLASASLSFCKRGGTNAAAYSPSPRKTKALLNARPSFSILSLQGERKTHLMVCLLSCKRKFAIA
ncbi:MAG: hypothetical protein PHW63_02100, partial [Alphaproteobacteria bacterium]|nr:hypothetical protein [Alphaproteobacteria bacterium]